MEPDEIEQLAGRIKSMMSDIEGFADEFAKLSDADLVKVAKLERDKADDAAWKADCAETAIQLRKLYAVISQAQST